MKKLLKSFIYAINGIQYTISTQFNFCIQLVMLLFVIIAGLLLDIEKVEWLIILFTSGTVLALELINTAFEALVDLTTKEYSELAKKAKDVAAGAVLMMSIVSVIIGLIIFLPYIL